jgi:aspartyl-tRNA(Asn)/glutamyl-tRNA(Gln) amidotransferase subunit A
VDSARERVTRALERIDRHDAALRAFIRTTGERALAEADRLDAEPGPPAALHGVTASLKDNIDLVGVPATAGNPHLRDRMPATDATVSRLLGASGAIVVGKNNMAEFAMGLTTQNRAFGSCRNRWDLARIPGGSSGGSAVAVAAGFSEISLGTDTGGSVRIPASVNGVVGLRPTIGRVSNRGVLPVGVSFDTVGPLGRDVRTVARTLAALDAFDDADPAAVAGPRPDVLTGLEEEVASLRVGVPTEYFFEGVEAGVHEVVAAAIAVLSGRGAAQVPIRIPGAPDAQGRMLTILYPEAAAVHRERMAGRSGTIDPDVLRRLRLGLAVTAAERECALAWREEFRGRVDEVFDTVDVVVTPTIPVDVPFLDDVDLAASTSEIARFTYVWSMYGGPSISVPCGFHPVSGMPVGLQLSAAPWREDLLLRVAARYEDATRWHEVRHPPALPG